MDLLTEEQKILEVSGISKQFYNIPDSIKTSKLGWLSLVKVLFSFNENSRNKELINALSEVSFDLSSGRSLGIIGLNGSGKSTLLQIISGTMQPSKGSVKVKGRIAALLELGTGFNPEFTGMENIFLTSSLYGLTKEETISKLESIIEFADIDDFIYQPIRIYSSGMILRLAFAIASQINAELLIIDEALAVGDAVFQLKCASFLENFKKNGGSLILVSHDLNSIAHFCDNCLVLNKGFISYIGRTINAINFYTREISIDNKKEKTSVGNMDLKRNVDKSIISMSIGGNKGIIEKYSINDSKLCSVSTGGELHIKFKVKALEKIKNPIYAVRIRNTKGQEIYGTNTNLQKTEVKDLNINDSCNIIFKLQANICSGTYFISLGFTQYIEGRLNVIHRLRECLQFEIIDSNRIFGISNCFAKIELTYK